LGFALREALKMKYCKKCNVYVRGDGRQCPLCFSNLAETDGDDGFAGYPDIQENSRKYNILFRLFLFLSIAGSLVCLLFNLFFWSGTLWTLIVVTGILLLWETIGLMIMSKRNAGLKVIGQTIVVLILLITIDAVTGWNQWSIGLIAPFVIISSTCAMTIVLYINRSRWREYMLFQFVITINGFIPVILYGCGLIKIIWPGAVGALYSLLTLLGMMIFADKQFKNELRKRFHV
jgi:hypothetical protein